MTNISTLVTNFSSAPTFFDGNFGSPTIVNGQGVVPTVNAYAGFATAGAYSLSGNSVYAQVVVASGTSGTRQNSIKCSIDANNSVEMLLSGGTFKGRVQSAGVNHDVSLNGGVYNSATHAWWRMREVAGVIYWDTSSDGVTWTNLGSATHGLNLTAVVLKLQAGYFGAAGSEVNPPNAVYDNLNTPATKVVETYTYVFGPGVNLQGDVAVQPLVDWLNSFSSDPALQWAFVTSNTGYSGLLPRTVFLNCSVDGANCNALNLPSTWPEAGAKGQWSIYYVPATRQISTQPL